MKEISKCYPCDISFKNAAGLASHRRSRAHKEMMQELEFISNKNLKPKTSFTKILEPNNKLLDTPPASDNEEEAEEDEVFEDDTVTSKNSSNKVIFLFLYKKIKNSIK